jgi:hypothetical protein
MLNLNADFLRTMVCENRENAQRLTAKQLEISATEYKSLTDLYSSALDAITEYASLDYKHADVKDAENMAFDAMKRILSLYTTDDSKVIIDSQSLRSLRDFATAPKRMYSAEYRKANKMLKDAQKTLNDRINDITTFDGVPARFIGESVTAWADRIRESGVSTMQNNVNMLDMLVNANATLERRTVNVENIKKEGHWTWRQPVAVTVAVFADMVENYVADCILDGYNLKTSKNIRDEKAAERAERKANKTK